MFNFENAALLQLFAEGGDGTGAPPAAEGQAGVAPDAAGQEETAEEAFARFTQKYGEDAKPLRDHHQKNFGKKYATFKETEAKAQRFSEFIETVAMRYPDIDATDIDALEKAFIGDTRFSDRRAFETGEDVEKLAKNDANELELKKLRAKEAAETKRKTQAATAEAFRARLAAEDTEMKKTYPDFDLNTELKDKRMWEKLKRGEPMRDAYIALHHDELLKKAIGDTKAATVNSIASGATRVTEGASSTAVPAAAKTDFRKMSRAEFMKFYNSR